MAYGQSPIGYASHTAPVLPAHLKQRVRNLPQ